MHVDEVTIPLFRSINVGHVYSNVKGGNSEMTFNDIGENGIEADDDSIFQANTALLRAATAGSEGFKDRPKLREALTGVSWMTDSSAKQVFESVTTLSPDDQEAEKQYLDVLEEIRTSSAIFQSQQRVIQCVKLGQDGSLQVENANDLRAATCAELQEVPSVVHPPLRSVRVTTLQGLTPPAVRRFLVRISIENLRRIYLPSY